MAKGRQKPWVPNQPTVGTLARSENNLVEKYLTVIMVIHYKKEGTDSYRDEKLMHQCSEWGGVAEGFLGRGQTWVIIFVPKILLHFHIHLHRRPQLWEQISHQICYLQPDNSSVWWMRIVIIVIMVIGKTEKIIFGRAHDDDDDDIDLLMMKMIWWW